MAEASLAAQRLAVTTMRARAALTYLVPAANIFDRGGLPSVFPCVLVGEAQTVGDDNDCADLSDVFLTVHVWTRETGMAEVKSISGEIRRALRDLSGIQDGFGLDFSFENARFLRDPSGEHSHGVVTFKALAEDTVGVL